MKRASLEDEYCKTLATILAGGFMLLTSYLTWRNVAVAQETLRTNQEGQIIDRYIRATDQLGATTGDGKPVMETRLGAIYALERIARDSLRDHGPNMEVLTAYVRHNSPAPDEDEDEWPTRTAPPADIQAILTVIGRRSERHRAAETDKINLNSTILRGTNLGEAHPENALLNEAHLEGTSLSKAHLEDTLLFEASLEDATLDDISLSRAHLEGANLRAVKGLTQEPIDEAWTSEQTRLDPPLRQSSRSSPPSAPTSQSTAP